jgi:pimeloyl-ACP methyl ester carboxylesterase
MMTCMKSALVTLAAWLAAPMPLLIAQSEPAGWSPETFDYDRPARLQVREANPGSRARVLSSTQKTLSFRDVQGQEVPVLMTLPPGNGPFPVAILVHGFASNREQITRHLTKSFVREGFATLAFDLPFHGARPGPPERLLVTDDPKKSRDNLVHAVINIRQMIDLAESRKELDTSKGVYLMGYSMGGWLSTLAAAADRRVEVLVLMVAVAGAAGEEDQEAVRKARNQATLLERYVDLRPTDALRRYAGHPVLLQHGRKDPYVSSEDVDALATAAGSKKELRWYDAGHLLPEKAFQEAAEWLRRQIKE